MAGTYRDTLAHKGLQPFLWTQFLGAFNDNLFKIVVSLFAVHVAGGSGGDRELSIISGIFILPFLLFSSYAGQVADIYSKRTVLVITKSLEIVATGLGLYAFAIGRLELTYVVLFLIALQATFFSPAKYGILPEALPERDLSRANGVLEMSTFVAIVVGVGCGSVMFDVWHERLWLIGVIVVAVALLGTALSFGIPPVPAAAPERRIDLNPWREIWLGVQRLRGDRILLLTVVGISYFWFLGSLLQTDMVLFGTHIMGLSDSRTGFLTTFAAIGIGAGSMTAGRLSGDKVELGLVPIGSIGMSVFAILLSRSSSSFAMAAVNLVLVGFFGGLFAVPLNALLQQRSGGQEKGRLMATNNFLNMAGILLSAAALWLCTSVLGIKADRVILVFGVLTLVSSVYVLAIVPHFLVRFCFWLLTHTIYRIRLGGEEHVAQRGPALLVCNHLSHVDGFLVGACVHRFIRFMVYRPIYEHWLLRYPLKWMKAIPVAPGRDALASLDRARQELKDGHVVCIFAEGSISRTGNLLPFKRGFEKIAGGLDVPIVPVYLDQVWGSVFSFKNGRFFWKWPARIPYPVTVAFGRPLTSSATAAEARLAMMELGSEVAAARQPADDVLGRRFVRTAKRRWFSFCMADSSGRRLTFGHALVASLLLSRLIRGRAAKLRMWLTAFLLPIRAINRLYVPEHDPERVATIVFSSGSTGNPKGVMLNHRNILSNVDAASQLFQLTRRDVMIGVLPFFHSFGFTGTLWLPLAAGFGAAYHPNPMDAKTIGELALAHRGSLMITTPTFAGAYLRKCRKEQFTHLRYAIVGAEKLRQPVAEAFREKFGIDLLEGYGCTEMAPIVAVSVPDITDAGERQRGWQPGSVGHPLPGIAAKIVDPDTFEGPLFDREGLLLVKGPNQMIGYLDDPERTREVVRDGWYVTGDIATIDEAGFIRITDRLSRFSKIAGEMVPHMRVEDEIRTLLSESHTAVVTAVPDAAKGERLVAFYTDGQVTPQDLWERLSRSALPRLWLPKREDLHPIEAIPTLGTGKTDLRAVRQLALDRTAAVGAR